MGDLNWNVQHTYNIHKKLENGYEPRTEKTPTAVITTTTATPNEEQQKGFWL